MTVIKYATVCFARSSERVVVARGKKSGQVGFLPPEDGDGSIFADPLYAEEVVELPEPMTPTEYDEYLKDGEEMPDKIREVVERVREEKGVEKGVTT